MKANELRIGNLVKCDALIDTYKDRMPYLGKHIHAVHSACVDFVKLELGDGAIQKVEIFAIKPVELTKEWLLKFGFELDYKSDYSISYGHIKNCKFSYKFNITENKSWLEYHGGAIECKYAHQLQNIYFALTGEELPVC